MSDRLVDHHIEVAPYPLHELPGSIADLGAQNLVCQTFSQKTIQGVIQEIARTLRTCYNSQDWVENGTAASVACT